MSSLFDKLIPNKLSKIIYFNEAANTSHARQNKNSGEKIAQNCKLNARLDSSIIGSNLQFLFFMSLCRSCLSQQICSYVSPHAFRLISTQDLPKVPVPDLHSTLERYLAGLKAVIPVAQYEQTKLTVDEFLKPNGEGEKLQKLLTEYANEKENWVSRGDKCICSTNNHSQV